MFDGLTAAQTTNPARLPECETVLTQVASQLIRKVTMLNSATGVTLPHIHAAINVQRLAGDIGRSRRGKKGNGRSDL
jgi:hypothetical protein